MKKILKRVLLVTLCLVGVTFCSLVTDPFLGMVALGAMNAGTWEDDPENWKRAFGVEQPPDLRILHSRYWNSGHFTHEYAYYFEVEASPRWREGFWREHGLLQEPPERVMGSLPPLSGNNIPDWFAPGTSDQYIKWEGAKDGLWVWVRKSDGRLFLHNRQV